MATCHRCGQVNRPESITCVTCGAPLAQPANPPVVGADDGLPDWLRQLQPGQPPTAQQPYPNTGYAAPQPQAGAPMFGAPPQQQQQQFSAGSLISDDALPEWLRAAGQSGAIPPSQTAPAPAGWNSGGVPANAYAQGMPGQPQSAVGMGYAGAQPMQGTSGSLGYSPSTGGLFDDAALPDWLREASRSSAVDPRQQQRAPAPQPPASPYGAGPGAPSPAAYSNGGYGVPQQQPGQSQQLFGQPSAPAQMASSAFPSIDQVGLHQPPSPAQAGLSGRALLDTGALPPWLGGRAGSAELSGNSGTSGVSSGMAAQSLIDETALPQWLRAEPNVPPAPAQPVAPSPSVSSRIAASASAEPLPPWLNQVYADANVARIEPQSPPPTWGMYPPPAAPAPAAAARPAASTGAGISASEFVDESALPDWLRSQGAMETPSAAPPPIPSPSPFGGMQADERVAPRYTPATDSWGAPTGVAGSRLLPTQQPSQEQSGQFAASDLIDASALPSWVRGDEAPAAPSFSSTTGWTSRQPAAPATPAPQPPSSQRLPEWGTANEWGAGGGPGSGMLSPQSFGGTDEDNGQWSSGQVVRDDGQWVSGQLPPDDGAPEWFPSEAPVASRHNHAPAPNNRRPDSRFGQRAPTSDLRRGPPIPSDQLPPWLQRGGAQQGMQGGQGGGFAVRGGHGPTQGGYPMGPENEYDAGNWSAGPAGNEEWSSWDEGQYGGQGYGGQGYGGYPPPQDDRQDRQRGGWRRLFGRK